MYKGRFPEETARERAALANLVDRAFFGENREAVEELTELDPNIGVLVQEALDGTPGALCQLGELFLSDRGALPVNETLARDFLELAAQAGSKNARVLMKNRGWKISENPHTSQRIEGGVHSIGNVLDELLTERWNDEESEGKKKK